MKRSGIGKGRGLAFLQSVVILAAGVASSTGAFATDYTSCTLPRTCMFEDYHPAVVYLKDFNCTSDPNGVGQLLSDRECWQAALDCAYDNASGSFGTVVATQGVEYEIDGTLCVNTSYHGVIDGNGARLQWTGPNSEDSPMWFLVDTQQLKIENLRVHSVPGQPLDTAFEFTNKSASGGVTPSGNILDHVYIDGGAVNGLKYGVRFSFRLGYSIDANNDLSIIQDSLIMNPTVSAISIEHGQSMYHRLINVGSVGAATASCSSFVSLHRRRLPADGCNAITDELLGQGGSGSFSVYGFTGGGFTNADYEISSAVSTNILIVQHNSESSNRLLEAVGASDGVWPVHFIGGRFAVDALDPDDHTWIHFDRQGPLRIDGMILDFVPPPPSPPPVLVFDPGDLGGTNSPVLELNGLQINGYNSAAHIGLVSLGSNGRIRVHSQGNVCLDGNKTSSCPEILGGAVTFSRLGAQPDGVSIYCSDCRATSTGECTSQGSGPTGAFARRVQGAWRCDGAELTLSGQQTVSNKTITATDLTAASNKFPELSVVTFTNSIASSTTSYCGPNTSLCGATEASVGFPFPHSVLRKLTCKAKVAPGGGRSIAVQVRSGGSNAGNLTCPITGSATSCFNATPSDTFVTLADADLDIRFISSGSGSWPSGLTVACSILTRPGDN